MHQDIEDKDLKNLSQRERIKFLWALLRQTKEQSHLKKFSRKDLVIGLLVLSLFVLGGVALMGLGYGLAQERIKFSQKALRAEGLVVAMEMKQSSGQASNRPLKHAIVRFQTAEGVVKTFTSDEAHIFGPQLGDKVIVLYDPENQDIARIDSFWSLYSMPALLLVIGAVFFLLCLPFLIKLLKTGML